MGPGWLCKRNQHWISIPLCVASSLELSMLTTLQDMTLLHAITHPSRLHDVKFCRLPNGTDEVILAAAEDKKLSVYNIPEDKDKSPRVISEMIGHSNR